MVRHTKIRSKLQILKRVSNERDSLHQRWQSRLPVSTHASVCDPYGAMHAHISRELFISFARLFGTIANYLAPLKDLEPSRRAARAAAADATSHASPNGWSTTENKAFICTGSAVAQQDADAAYCDVLPGLLVPLNARGKSSPSLVQISEETLVASYVIEQLQLQLMPAFATATFSIRCKPLLTFQQASVLAKYNGYGIS